AIDELVGRNSTDVLLTAQPNAGLPQRLENRFLYGAPPQYFGEYAHRFVEAGVRLMGGCCGTTPAHIAAMRDALASHLPTPTQSSFAAPPVAPASPFVEPPHTVPEEVGPHGVPHTRLRQELDGGRFVVIIDRAPPKGLNPQKILDGAAYL